MKTKWNLDPVSYSLYQDHQRLSYEDPEEGSGEGNYIGNLRIGNLCYDILDWGNHLWLDLYVGGVDSGYDYSNRLKDKGIENYPYDYCDIASFRWDDNVRTTHFEIFKQELEAYCIEHIKAIEGYIVQGQAVSLIEEANKPILEW